jgi:hypothetical protein
MYTVPSSQHISKNNLKYNGADFAFTFLKPQVPDASCNGGRFEASEIANKADGKWLHYANSMPVAKSQVRRDHCKQTVYQCVEPIYSHARRHSKVYCEVAILNIQKVVATETGGT